jgi:FdhE protein
MTEATTVKIMSPEEIAARQVGDVPPIRFADTTRVFADRETRLRQLAAGHAMRDYLIFMADVAAAQHRALQAPRVSPLPGEEALGEAARAGVAPLQPTLFRRSAEWRDDLNDILAGLLPHLADGPARDTVLALQAAPVQELERQADRLLAGVMLGLDLGQAPLIGAALQVYWTRLVAHTQAQYPDLAFGRVDDATACPCCGGKPVASVVRLGTNDTGTRYLHCSLCQSQWHMVRVKCSRCESTRSIFYQELEPATSGAQQPTAAPPRGAVRTESCDECNHYLKIVSMEKDAYVDPVADDLASVTLDLLVSESGKLRHGVNFMLLFGAPPDEADEPEAQAAGSP